MDDKPAKKAEKAEQTPLEAPHIPATDRKRDKKTAWWVSIVAVVLLIGLGLGVLIRLDNYNHERRSFAGSMVIGGMLPHRAMMHGQTINPTDGTTISRLSGVVTQVGNNNFTIAGNGTTRTITTNSSTTYNVSSNKVAVNDSVVVAGTDNNGTFTATQVDVENANQ